jgi:hypothetical protein
VRNVWVPIAEAMLQSSNRAAFVKSAYLAAWRELEARGFPDAIIDDQLKLLLATFNEAVDAERERAENKRRLH